MANLQLKQSSGSGTITLKGAASGSNDVELTLPNAIGSNDQFIKLGSVSGQTGTLSFGSATSTLVDWKYVNKTDEFSEASIAAGGVSGAAISIAYTAASTSNRLLITASLMINTSSNARHGVIAYKDGSAFARGDAHPDGQGSLARMSASGYNEGMSYTMDSMPFQFIDTPADTSAHTYDFRIWNGKNGSNTVYLNRTSTGDDYAYLQGTGISSISILELNPQQT